MATKRKIAGLRAGGGVAGTLDAFLNRAESVLQHEILLTRRKLSLGPLMGQKRSSLGAISKAKSPVAVPQPINGLTVHSTETGLAGSVLMDLNPDVGEVETSTPRDSSDLVVAPSPGVTTQSASLGPSQILVPDSPVALTTQQSSQLKSLRVDRVE